MQAHSGLEDDQPGPSSRGHAPPLSLLDDEGATNEAIEPAEPAAPPSLAQLQVERRRRMARRSRDYFRKLQKVQPAKGLFGTIFTAAIDIATVACCSLSICDITHGRFPKGGNPKKSPCLCGIVVGADKHNGSATCTAAPQDPSFKGRPAERYAWLQAHAGIPGVYVPQVRLPYV